ncbi:uncharacterized protein LOC131030630 isoform X1 [Cryptomeria japonica]|uniref:uncharacterized protein LOC131030630 isoform X1 n=1 Tax=Cryptomeria japonica TaxID=3369 RepID=UPI0027DA3182|nr:uncharacterized protein LOC131030630 isoform X1 [Cryptomeria japonica]XP_057817504.2 uncharacterized protein LOC131030630 isoform X1 [Cryptomeria japonica]
MPLFKRKPFPLARAPEDIKPNDLVFQIRFTKEIFKDYQEYLERINLYRQRVWVCRVTGKTNLTYEEALVSERCATEKVQQFPKDLIGLVLRNIQFSTLRLKELVPKISQSIKDVFLVGEEVTGRKADTLIPCKILKVIQEIDDSEGTFKYEVGWLDKNKQLTDASVESAETLVRKKPLVTQDVLKSFIRESTRCSTPPCWIVHDELAKKYRLPTDIPEDLKNKIVKQEKQHDPHSEGNKKSSEQNMENGENGSKKRKRKETEEGDEGSKAKKEKDKVEEQPKVEPIKYPIEDSLVQPGPDDPVFTERPLPATDFLMPMDCVGDLLMVWDFCVSFNKVLHLWPFSLEDFEKAIDYKEGDITLLAETHCALLRIVLKDSSAYEDLMQKKKMPKLSVQNWQDHLCAFFEVEEVGKYSNHLEEIRGGNYRGLSPHAKLGFLHELVDRAFPSDVIRGQLDEYIEERQALAATKREEEMEESRRKKEQLLLLKQQNAEGKEDPDGNVTQGNGENIKTMDALDSDVLKSASEQNGSASEQNGSTSGHKRSNSDNGVTKTSDANKTQIVSENHYENGDVNHSLMPTSRRAALQQKLDAKAAEEREKEMARLEEQKKMQEKRKAKAEIVKEQKLREQRALEMQKRQEHFEREIEKRFIRTNSLGKDKNYNRYWFFRREGRLFVESEDSSQWGYYSAKEELELLMGSLNPKGVREKALQRQLEKHCTNISNAMQRRLKEIAQRFALEEAAIRRSTRVRSQPKAAGVGFLSYVNKHRG